MPVDRAIVLRRFPYSESSLVLRALSREHGRLHLIARGAYRPRSRYYALLDLFDTLELEWTGREERELKELRAGRLVVRRRHVTASLEAYRSGLAMLELADLGSRPAQPDARLFDLLERSLERLRDAERHPHWALVVFELGFLQAHGLAPALTTCASCGGPAPAEPRARHDAVARAAFSAGAGGRLCQDCAAGARAAGRRVGTLPLDVLDGAAALLALADDAGSLPADPRAARQLPHDPEPGPEPEPELLVRLRDFVERFLDYHLETRPRSHEAFLAVPNRNAPSR